MVAGGPEGDGRADERSSSASPTAGRPGRLVLSINDVPQVRELFGGFALEPLALSYTITKGAATPARALIVAG